MSEILDQQDREIDLLSEAVTQLQDKLEYILITDSSSPEVAKDFPSVGYVIGDHLARNNQRINDIQEKIATVRERLPL